MPPRTNPKNRAANPGTPKPRDVLTPAERKAVEWWRSMDHPRELLAIIDRLAPVPK